MLHLLLACASPPVESPLPPPIDQVVDVVVTARTSEAGGVWTAAATVRPWPAAHRRPPAPGVCEPLPGPDAGLDDYTALRIVGPEALELRWEPELGRLIAPGPRRAGDPAWQVADLRWSQANGAEGEVIGALRFGAAPLVTAVERTRDGGVKLAWSPMSGAEIEVLTTSPAGALRCGALRDGAELPWWAVPALGGTVVVRASRDRSTTVDRTMFHTHAIIEVPVSLDAPVLVPVIEPTPRVVKDPAPQPRRWRSRIVVG